jgi:iron complex outermembrane receptor protein
MMGHKAPLGEGMAKLARKIVLLGLVLASAAYADDEAGLAELLPMSLEDLMDVKVTISTHTKQKLSKAPSVVSVITAEDIRAAGTTNLMEILEGVPGVYVRTNLFGFRPLVTFRGAAGTHTLLMINGAPIKDLVWSSGIFWKGMPVSAIDRIEIIRGPGSALFGSDASAGVINVITKTAGKIEQSEAGIRTGSANSRGGWIQYGSAWNGIDVGLTADGFRTDGHRPRIDADAQTAQDAIAGTGVSRAPGEARNGWDSQEVRFSLGTGNWRLLADHVRHGNVAIGLTGAGVLDPQTRGSDSQTNLALLYNNERYAKDWGFNAELRFRDLDYTSGEGFWERPPGYRDATGTYPNGYLNQMRSAERRLNVEASGLYSGVRNHAVRIGGGYVRQDLYRVEQYVNKGLGVTGSALPAGGPLVNVSDSPYAFAPEMARKIGYLFIQDVWSLADNWELTAGVRQDHYSDFGSAVTPRLALVWQSTDRLTAKLLYGRAFRAPSYLELYAQTSATIPNPALTPERSRTWDMSFSYLASTDLSFSVNLFDFAQSDLIAINSGNQYQNAGNHTIRGIESEFHWQAAKALKVSGSFTHRRQDDSRFLVYGIPDREAYLRGDWRFLPRWSWNLQANWFGKRTVPVGDTRRPLGAQTVADTTVRYLYDKHWEFAVSVRNLFDADVREYTSSAIQAYLPLPGRSFHAEARYRF